MNFRRNRSRRAASPSAVPRPDRFPSPVLRAPLLAEAGVVARATSPPRLAGGLIDEDELVGIQHRPARAGKAVAGGVVLEHPCLVRLGRAAEGQLIKACDL